MPRAAPNDPPAVLWLVVSSASGVESRPLPVGARVVIGRAENRDIVIDDDSVSRRHAALPDRQLEKK